MQVLKYRPNQRHDDGPRIYYGHPADFKEWQFRTEMKALQVRSDEAKAAKYVQEVMAGLAGEALQLAQDIGVKDLCKKDGIDVLIAKMQKIAFPTLRQEASQLYAIGLEKGGILSRQTAQNEPMSSYIERRTQWWKMMQEFDKTVVIADEVRGGQLLENSGLTRDQKTMIMVSTQNKLDLESVKTALIAQHGMMHVKSHNYTASAPSQSSYRWNKGKGRGNSR